MWATFEILHGLVCPEPEAQEAIGEKIGMVGGAILWRVMNVRQNSVDNICEAS